MPGFRTTVVPAPSAPGNEAGLGVLPVTVRVKSADVRVPPLALTTFLMTMSCAGTSSLVTVQVLLSPTAIVPAQSADSDFLYPATATSSTLYAPAFSVTTVPDSEPGNDGVETAAPVTSIVKSPAAFVPPWSLTTCLITVRRGVTSLLVIVH